MTIVAMATLDTYIATCPQCTGTEIVWHPTASPNVHICSKCIDKQQITKHRLAVTRLHRQLHSALPQILVTHIYDFAFPTNHAQWKLLNGHNYMQRKQTLYRLLIGVPRSNNWIHDLQVQLHFQNIRLCRCNVVDLYTNLLDLLT